MYYQFRTLSAYSKLRFVDAKLNKEINTFKNYNEKVIKFF